MALYCGLTAEHQFGGIFGLSGFWIPTMSISSKASTTPVYISHGENDYMIPWKWASFSYAPLKSIIKTLHLNVVEGLEHGIEDSQIEFIARYFEMWNKTE